MANVSHELRTPLTTIKGCAATLADGALEDPEAAQRFVDSINSHAERLHLLVDDLLDLSQLESGTLDVEPVPFNLRRVAAAALDTVKVLSAEKSIDVVNDVAPSLKLSGDPRLIQQALINLLDNAIKYTSAGGRVTVSAVSAEDRPTSGPGVPTASPAPTAGAALSEESGPRLAVEVSDNGPGIPSDDLPRIFERFYRVEKARSRALGGTGLGLSIVRHILEAHGERVYVRSELGRGTTFGFTLPISDGGY